MTATVRNSRGVPLEGADDAVASASESNDVHSEEMQIARLEVVVERLKNENRTLKREKDELTSVLNGVLGSASWRATKPLRTLAHSRRAIKNSFFPIVRFGSVKPKFVPERDIQIKGTKFLIDGVSPVLKIGDDGDIPPRGWVTVSGTLRSAHHHLFFYLYFIRGGTANEQDRVLLPFIADERLSVVCRIPGDTTALRLQPFNDDGEFALDGFQLKKIGSAQVAIGIAAKHLRSARSNPRLLASKGRKAYFTWREGGVAALRHKLFSDQSSATDYQDWVRRFDTLSDADRNAIKTKILTLPKTPLVSIVMPVYNVEAQWLSAAIESVQAQLYPHWELCIADDASTAPHIAPLLAGYAAQDARIKVTTLEKNSHISVASNRALELATGEYIALLDNDDALTEHALYMAVEAINAHPAAVFLYSDEDKLTSGGMRFNPYFKPGWNPLLLLAQNYLCHLCVYKTEAVRAVCGFRAGLEGAQDWDLALRVTENLSDDQIHHIPHILYHWRVIEGSTAQSTSYKPYVLQAQQRAVSEHLARTGITDSSVEILEGIAQLRAHFSLPKVEPSVSIIIPTRDRMDLLKHCVDSILEKTVYRNFEIFIIDNNSTHAETLKYFEQLETLDNVTVIRDRSPFNYAALNNRAVKIAKGELLAFLNNDLEVITPEWLGEMVSHALLPKAGAVGAKLIFPNNLIQHAGVLLGINGVAGHSHKGRLRGDPGYFNRIILPQYVSAVTAACMVVRRSVFEEVGGFDEEALAVAFNDVDLCLRIQEKGYRNIYDPYAELYHFESASRGYETTPEKFVRFEGEVELMKSRWGKKLANDPYYNPNLTLLNEDFHFAFPPRVRRPWKS